MNSIIGSTLGDYEIVREIGKGGMGAVYEGKHKDTGEAAAVKVLPPEMTMNPAFVMRFKREVATLEQLDHPNIVKMYDHGEAEGIHYFAMELIEGDSLDRRLEGADEPTPVERALDIARDVAQALEHAHARGVVHRDLKPANIMITASDTVKLTDFGIAKLVEGTRMTTTGGIIGTPEYMSPEQAEGGIVTERSDIYALGVVLYQMITGRLPFQGKTALQVMQKHRYSRHESAKALNPKISMRLGRFIDTLLDKDPKQRTPSATVLVQELDRLREQHTLAIELAPDEEEGKPPTSPPRREPTRIPKKEREKPTPSFYVEPAIWKTVLVFVVIACVWGMYLVRPGPEKLYRQAESQFEKNEYDDVEETLGELQQRFPDSDEARRADDLLEQARRKREAKERQRRKDMDAAIGIAANLLKGEIPPDAPNPAFDKHAKRLLGKARAAFEKKDYVNALLTLHDVKRLFHGTPWAREADKMIREIKTAQDAHGEQKNK